MAVTGSASGVGAGTCGWAGILAACGTTTVGLTCTGPAGSVQDTLEVRTCGNGVCDTACENATDCPQDCSPPPPPPSGRILTVHVHHTQGSGCAGGGVVFSSPAGINCTCTGNCNTTCFNPFPEGTQVTLTAEVIGDATFTGWTGCDTVSGDICIVTMNADRSVSAGFASVGACPP